MKGRIRVQDRLPQGHLGQVVNGELRHVGVEDTFAARRVIIVGVPGAFTPVCSRAHLPKFVELAPSLLASGFDMIAVLAANDPWTMAAWARDLDPDGRLHFLSDGNLEFGDGAGLTTRAPTIFLNRCLERFVLISRNCVVEKVSVEQSPLHVSTTGAETCLISSQQEVRL